MSNDLECSLESATAIAIATAIATANSSPIGCHGSSGDSPSSAQRRQRPSPPFDKFYGRKQEEAILFQLFHQCIGRSSSSSIITGTLNGCQRQDCTLSPRPISSTANGANDGQYRYFARRCSRLVILQGSKGVGKQTLSQRLRPVVQEAEGLYVSVSFSQQSRDPRCATLRSNDHPIGCAVLLHIMEHVIQSLSKERWNTLRDQVYQRFFTEPSEWQALRKILSTLSEHGIRDPQGTPLATRQPSRSLDVPDPEAEASEMFAPKALHVLPHSTKADHRPFTAPIAFQSPNHTSATVPRDSLDNLTTGSATTGTRNGHEIMVRCIVAVATLMPLVVHLDAAHHAVAADLDVVQSLVYHDDDGSHALARCGLLVILCREMNTTLSTNDAPASESVAVASSHFDLQKQRHGDDTKPSLDNIRCCCRIQLDNLSRDHIEQWIGDWRNECKSGNVNDNHGDGLAQSRDLTDLVFQRTLGNPRHVHFLLLLCQLEGLRDDSGQGGVDQIRQSLPSDDSSLLFQQIIQRQDPLVQGVIETMAALIECDAFVRVTASMLEMVASQPCNQALSVALEYKLLAYRQEFYHFTDSIFQRAAYAMIPESKRAKVHLRIGRGMWKYSSLGGAVAENASLDTDTLLFTVARQLERGADEVTDPSERDLIAKIQWEAGKRAMQLSEFSSAAAYFEGAISILRNERTWSADHYGLNLALHNGAAEAYYCIGDFVRTDRMLEKVFENATTFEDKLQAYSTLVFALGARHRLSKAVTTALEVLDQLDVSLPTNPSRILVFMEYMKTRHLLRGKSDRFFLNLPLAKNSNIIAAMTLLNFTLLYSYSIKPELGALAVFRLIHLVIQHGLCGSALSAFSGYGLLLASMFGNNEEAYRFGKIALALADIVESKAWLPRIYVMVYGVINTWVNPFRESMEPLLLAYRSALKTGDIEGSVTCATVYVMSAFFAGKPLYALGFEAISICHLMNSLGQTTGVVFLLPISNLICRLNGTTPVEVAFADNVNDPSSALKFVEKSGNRYVVTHYNIILSMKWSIMGEYQQSVDAAARARKASTDIDVGLEFFESLSSLALARESMGWHRRSLVSRGKRALRRIRKWAIKCPANFRNKRALLQAELATLRGQSTRALVLFDEAIAVAKCEGFVHEEGLAYERLAQYHCFLGRAHSADPYFCFARDAYARWGAHKLVQRIDEIRATKCGLREPQLA
jgi:tetratricopeptide (TPR) repeat protein